MKNSTFILFILFGFLACAPKVYFFEAEKLTTSSSEITLPPDIQAGAFFAGDALDYVVFELDVANNSTDSITVNFRDVYLEVQEHPARAIIIDAISKDDIIRSLHERHRQLESEKKARDVGNAIGIGLDLLVMGSSGGINTVGGLIYAADVATYMLEDSRAHKLMVGDLQDQIAYVEEWVLDSVKLGPGERGSWDILLPRRLFTAPATFYWNPDQLSFSQDFELSILEERVR